MFCLAEIKSLLFIVASKWQEIMEKSYVILIRFFGQCVTCSWLFKMAIMVLLSLKFIYLTRPALVLKYELFLM